MATLNGNYRKLQAGYLFPEIGKRTKEFVTKNPDALIMRLGIGDTSEPLAPSVIAGLHDSVDRLSKAETYSGYCDDGVGTPELREALAARYASYGVNIKVDEVFVGDGAKGDSANIQSLFGESNVVAVQDPAYPVYVDSNVIAGKTGEGSDGQYDGLFYMLCVEENDFFPKTPSEKVDLIYLCSPNNPTGAVATLHQLKAFVDYARENKAVIIFDSAYASYISDPRLPRTIYEVEGAKECAIEINSFSKEAGF
ncbi:MAG: aminotransferase class I/II-fold pyridoxal phosphate-dependent enzyme, partial [Candidatus Hydrogenedentes bacterium]|nr:aminotransferase class I/II-fold pyridoxal phosphate-dependent enzyme [Candidatus Hydrogenedentota bacterium]